MIDRERLRADVTYRQMVFEALFNKYHLDIARYCATRVGELLAEDVAQAVFGIVWRLSYVPGYDEVRAI